jgi:hypothetical protein
MFRTVEVTLHKEGNTFGFVIRGKWRLKGMGEIQRAPLKPDVSRGEIIF